MLAGALLKAPRQVERARATVVHDLVGRGAGDAIDDEARAGVELRAVRAGMRGEVGLAREPRDAEVPPPRDRDLAVEARLAVGVVGAREAQLRHRLAAALPLRRTAGEGMRKED